MRFALALLVLPAFVSAAHAADVKGTSRIDAVTVFPSGAEITRVGKVKLEGGDHVILFTDLPARAIHSSIRVEGKADGLARDRLGRQPPRVRAAHRRRHRRHREEARRGRHREAQGRQGRPADGRAGGRDAEDADRQPGAAPHAPGARQRRCAAPARLGAALRPHRRAPRRGAEDHPRHADQGPRRRPADQGPGRQARLPGAGAGGAHRGQGVRQRRRAARGRDGDPLSGRRRLVAALLRRAPRHRHQGAGAQAAAGAPRQHPAAHAARAGTRWRWRCRPPVRAPAPRRPSCSP